MLCATLSYGTDPNFDSQIVKKNGTWDACDGDYTCDLMIIDEDSNKQKILPLSDLYPGELYKVHVNETTAGPEWGIDSVSFIVNLNSRPYFAMHSWTGHRLLIDLESALIVDPTKFPKELDDEEVKQITKAIMDSAQILSKTQNGPVNNLNGAIVLAAKRNLHNIRKHLEVIEKYASWGGPFGWNDKTVYGKGLNKKVRKGTWQMLECRRFAQLGLRRLGFTPLGYPQYVFEEGKESRAINPADRRHKALAVKTNSPSQTVYESLGTPDYIFNAVEDDDTKPYKYLKKKWVSAWRYDFSSPDDFSLIFIWDDNGLIRRIEKITPALWRGDDLFSAKMPKPVFGADGRVNGIHLYSPYFLGRIDVIEKESSESNNAIDNNKK